MPSEPRAQQAVQPPPSGTPVTVVIATRDRPRLLHDALSALHASLRPGDALVVVDSASRQPAVAGVARAAGATVLRCERPGTCRARNVGWQAANTDIVAVTDDDCLPAPGWVAALAGALERSPSASFVTGQVVPGSTRRARGELGLSLLVSDHPAAFGPASDPATVGHGANMAWRRRALAAIGGFDELLGPGSPLRAAEDHDAFWRALAAGGTGIFEPAAVVVHRSWRTRRQQVRAYYAYGVGTGALAVKRWRLTGRAAAGSPLGPLPSVRLATPELLWRHGVARIAGNLVRGYEMSALAETAKLAGVVHGVAMARRLRLDHGHFQAGDRIAATAGAGHPDRPAATRCPDPPPRRD